MGAAGAGAIVQGISEMGTNIINSAALAVNKRTAESNARFQERAALANLLLQGLSWRREDNAVQRRVADLRAAGLSPTLAAGSAAQSQPASQVKAPQNEFLFPYNVIKTQIGKMILESSLANAQIQKMNSEKERMDTLSFLDLMSMPHKLKNLDARTNAIAQDIIKKQLDNYWYKATGVPPGSSEVGRTISDTTRILNSIINGIYNSINNKGKGEKK